MSFFKKNLTKIIESGVGLKKTTNIVIAGLLIALYVVIAATNVKISDVLQIRFGFIILSVAGLVGGPIMGLCVGALGDILSMILSGGQGSGFFFGFTLSYALIGFFAGLIFYKAKITPIHALLGGIVEFANAMLLNSLWLSIMTGASYSSMFITRLPKNIIMLPINSMLLFIVIKALATALRKSKVIDN
ncbi:folate family ECF transporter S component [Anaeromicropila herbilytica]|uniref:Folate transporter FolT n=1 Tax=Anaeromicropila herbilytica TaxID=2785025 RepID=A0A7R7IC77_9FIRM|nr:folate family ECF transporter S component [Anaeromicropila herbilytica]BCN30438.1 folate transporter FolT [Anaeromicropila herbilytica]